MMSQLKKISETVVSARWHRGLLWLAMALVMAGMFFANAQLYKTDRDSAVLASMITSLPPTLICDRDGTIVFNNPQALVFFEEDHIPKIRGHSVKEWMRPELAAKHEKYFQDVTRRPLGAMEILETEFIVHEKPKPVYLKIVVGVVNGDRIFTLTWAERDEQRMANEEDND